METRIRTPDVIHTNVKGFFQQLTTALVAATSKKRGGTTGKRHQTTGHDGTSTPTLAPRLHFSWHVIAIRRPLGTITNAYEISNLFNCPEHRQKNIKELIQTSSTTHGRSFTISGNVIVRRWTPHLKFTSGQIRNNISNSISRMSRGLPGRIKY